MIEKKIALVAAFKGAKFIPSPFTLGHNNLNPKLILKDAGIEFRSMFLTQHKKYADIQEVDVYINKIKLAGISTTLIILSFKDSIFTFSGNVNSLEKLKELVLFFKEQHCPISKNAQNLLI